VFRDSVTGTVFRDCTAFGDRYWHWVQSLGLCSDTGTMFRDWQCVQRLSYWYYVQRLGYWHCVQRLCTAFRDAETGTVFRDWDCVHILTLCLETGSVFSDSVTGTVFRDWHCFGDADTGSVFRDWQCVQRCRYWQCVQRLAMCSEMHRLALCSETVTVCRVCSADYIKGAASLRNVIIVCSFYTWRRHLSSWLKLVRSWNDLLHQIPTK